MQIPRFCLLNTRPAHQAQDLTDLVLAEGGLSLSCPTIQIEWLDLTETQISSWSNFDLVIITSRNAVLGLESVRSKLQSSEIIQPTCFAIGQGTYNEALKHHWHLQQVESAQFDSEHLLQSEPMQMAQIEHKQVLIIKGEQGRNLLAETLSDRGAKVETWSLYKRNPTEFCACAWQVFQTASTPVTLISSVESLQNILNQFQVLPNKQAQNYQAWWFSTSFVVFSQRIKLALEQAFENFEHQHSDLDSSFKLGRIETVPTQSDAGVIMAIERLL